MSRITTITFMLAALGMATPSVLYHLPDVSESLPSMEEERAKERPDSPPCYFHSWPQSSSNPVVKALTPIRAWEVPESGNRIRSERKIGVT